MRKTNNSLHHIKNKILLATYIFRSLPIEDIQRTTNNTAERQKIRNSIVFLKRDAYITQKSSLRGDKFIYLTKKGYTYVHEQLLQNGESDALYQHKGYRQLKKSVSEHSFMNFIFVWHYLSTSSNTVNAALRIYEESDMNKCKVPVHFAGSNLIVSPDVIVYTPEQENSLLYNAIFIENDNGREQYKVLYHKIVEYALLVEKGMQHNKLSKVSLYFVFRSKRRINQLFYSQEGLTRFFSAFNNTSQVKDVRIRTILQALTNPKFTIFISYLDESTIATPYDFQEYHLAEMLLVKNPSWKIYT